MRIYNLQAFTPYKQNLLLNKTYTRQEKSECKQKLSAPEENPVLYSNKHLQAHYLTNALNFRGNYRISSKQFPFAELQGQIHCPCCGEIMRDSDTTAKKFLAQTIASKKRKRLI